MAIPNFQHFMLPVLKAAATGNVNLADVVKDIAAQMRFSEEDRKQTISNGTSLIYNRIAWAKTYLMQASLIHSMGRGQFTISPEGKKLLATNPKEINNKTLEEYESFKEFRKRSNKSSDTSTKTSAGCELDELSPEEAIHESLDSINSSLSGELIERIKKANPAFLENLIIKLLVAMGYSNNTEQGWAHTGKTGDDGVDGIINQDVLGVDRIYIQAKRHTGSIGSSTIREFVGALDTHRATKGVFVTTSHFTANAKTTADQATKNVVLIDGEQLAQLLIKYSVGCKTKETINIQKIDEDFFEEM
ncbi:restriction endonuclease [bacterium]|nr:restriction endonuclease [bacterium]